MDKQNGHKGILWYVYISIELINKMAWNEGGGQAPAWVRNPGKKVTAAFCLSIDELTPPPPPLPDDRATG